MIRDITAAPRPAATPPTADATSASTMRAAKAAPAAADAPMLPNPRLRIDAALNIVVLEFRDDGSGTSRSIPSAQEIKAYRDGTAETSAEAPPALDVQR